MEQHKDDYKLHHGEKYEKFNPVPNPIIFLALGLAVLIGIGYIIWKALTGG